MGAFEGGVGVEVGAQFGAVELGALLGREGVDAAPGAVVVVVLDGAEDAAVEVRLGPQERQGVPGQARVGLGFEVPGVDLGAAGGAGRDGSGEGLGEERFEGFGDVGRVGVVAEEVGDEHGVALVEDRAAEGAGPVDADAGAVRALPPLRSLAVRGNDAIPWRAVVRLFGRACPLGM
nr:hypothetical protein GCM10025732_36310 [Glycomyces mayteni]